MTIKSVILSGGSGTRLWPASRESHPKQLLALTGERSLLQETALRLSGFAADEVDPQAIVVTNAEYRFIIAEQLRQIGAEGANAPGIVLEPAGRNTAPALTLAALLAAGEGDPVLLVMPADHLIGDLAAFQRAIAVGAGRGAAGRSSPSASSPTTPRPATATSAPARRWARRRARGCSPSSSRSPTAPPPNATWPAASTSGTAASS